MSYLGLPRFRLRAGAMLLAGALALTTAAATAFAGPRGEFSREDAEIIQQKWPDAAEMPSGLRYVVLKPGDGPRPLQRQRLAVLYRGSLLDGREFSAALDPEKPFKFALGAREVILGWEQAFAEMRPGEKRLLIIPYALGYGLRGRPPDIPNRATLVFEVELLAIE